MSEEVQELVHQTAKETGNQDEQMVKRRNKKKIKATIYLTEEAEQAFTSNSRSEVFYPSQNIMENFRKLGNALNQLWSKNIKNLRIH